MTFEFRVVFPLMADFDPIGNRRLQTVDHLRGIGLRSRRGEVVRVGGVVVRILRSRPRTGR